MRKGLVLKSIRNLIVLQLFYGLIIFIVCLFRKSLTLNSYGFGFIIMGVLSIAIGVLSVYGNMTTRSNIRYQYTRTAGVQGGSKRVQEDINLTNQSLNFFQYMFISGIISTIIGGIIV